MVAPLRQYLTRDNTMSISKAKALLFEGAEEGNLNKIRRALRVVRNFDDFRDEFGYNPLHSAFAHLHAVKYLIAQGADINSRNSNGKTILHLMYSNLEAVKYLIDNGANINIRDNVGNTPLHYLSGYYDIIKRNFLQGVEYEDETEEERERCRNFVQYYNEDSSKYLDVMCFLIFKGVDVNIKNKRGDTPLRLATEWGDLELIKCLVDNGAK